MPKGVEHVIMGTERSEKLVYVTEQEIWNVMCGWQTQDFVRLPLYVGFPEDTQVLGMWPVPLAHSWAIIISHPSFDIVPIGQMAPNGGNAQCIHVTMKITGRSDTENQGVELVVDASTVEVGT